MLNKEFLEDIDKLTSNLLGDISVSDSFDLHTKKLVNFDIYNNEVSVNDYIDEDKNDVSSLVTVTINQDKYKYLIYHKSLLAVIRRLYESTEQEEKNILITFAHDLLSKIKQVLKHKKSVPLQENLTPKKIKTFAAYYFETAKIEYDLVILNSKNKSEKNYQDALLEQYNTLYDQLLTNGSNVENDNNKSEEADSSLNSELTNSPENDNSPSNDEYNTDENDVINSDSNNCDSLSDDYLSESCKNSTLSDSNGSDSESKNEEPEKEDSLIQQIAKLHLSDELLDENNEDFNNSFSILNQARYNKLRNTIKFVIDHPHLFYWQNQGSSVPLWFGAEFRKNAPLREIIAGLLRSEAEISHQSKEECTHSRELIVSWYEAFFKDENPDKPRACVDGFIANINYLFHDTLENKLELLNSINSEYNYPLRYKISKPNETEIVQEDINRQSLDDEISEDDQISEQTPNTQKKNKASPVQFIYTNGDGITTQARRRAKEKGAKWSFIVASFVGLGSYIMVLLAIFSMLAGHVYILALLAALTIFNLIVNWKFFRGALNTFFEKLYNKELFGKNSFFGELNFKKSIALLLSVATAITTGFVLFSATLITTIAPWVTLLTGFIGIVTGFAFATLISKWLYDLGPKMKECIKDFRKTGTEEYNRKENTSGRIFTAFKYIAKTLSVVIISTAILFAGIAVVHGFATGLSLFITNSMIATGLLCAVAVVGYSFIALPGAFLIEKGLSAVVNALFIKPIKALLSLFKAKEKSSSKNEPLSDSDDNNGEILTDTESKLSPKIESPFTNPETLYGRTLRTAYNLYSYGTVVFNGLINGLLAFAGAIVPALRVFSAVSAALDSTAVTIQGRAKELEENLVKVDSKTVWQKQQVFEKEAANDDCLGVDDNNIKKESAPEDASSNEKIYEGLKNKYILGRQIFFNTAPVVDVKKPEENGSSQFDSHKVTNHA